jgi:hypothetical protein
MLADRVALAAVPVVALHPVLVAAGLQVHQAALLGLAYLWGKGQ